MTGRESTDPVERCSSPLKFGDDFFDSVTFEAFWARMQANLPNRERWQKTRVELANAIYEVP